VFTTAAEAKTYVAQHAFPLVIKADGLAAGKGVVIAANQAEAESTIDAMLSGRRHGAAGERIVIEEFLAGDELSCIAIVDGERYLLCEGSRDHKALEDGDQGPNTGGMGAFSPTHLWNETRRRTIATTVIEPTIAGLARDERRFSGFLYAGLMIVNGNPYVLEYNVRMGDPEAQALLIRLQSDLAEVLLSAATGNLQSTALQWDPRAACCVVMAAPGYPGPVTTGTPIQGLDAAAQIADCVVFHAGTASNDGQLVTAGGRVVGVTALGEDLRIAQASAYEAVGMIDWPGVQHRTDIGMKELC
jgi:phosphoribosylamine---glycine ligase